MKIKNVKVYGLPESIIRSGYPMNTREPEDFTDASIERQMFPSAPHKKRAIKLANTPSGSGHNNFLKGIIVQFDLQYPEYFSPQLQRYNWVDIISSQSKMHKILSKPLVQTDFANAINEDYLSWLNDRIHNHDFNAVINGLPSGYLKWMAISTNYLQLRTIWNQRCKHGHKLDEWRVFGEFIETLPMAIELIIGEQ